MEQSPDLRLVIAVSRAPVAPYEWIYQNGPVATWLREPPPPGVAIVTFGGRPIPKWRLPLTAIRARLRLLGPFPIDMTLAGRRTLAVRLTESLLERAFPSRVSLASKLLAGTLKGISRGIDYFDAAAAIVRHRLVGNPSATMAGTHIRVNRIQTLANFADVRISTLDFINRNLKPEGVVMVTSSTYVDIPRTFAWHCAARESGIEFACMPGVVAGRRFFSGGCNYFSNAGIAKVLQAPILRGGLLEDSAFTRWMRRSSTDWSDMPVHHILGTEIPSLCPLCADSAIIAVRCTAHQLRQLEFDRMRFLNHPHPTR